MNTSINTFVLTLLEATVSLYPANADGSPNLSAPIWTGVDVEALAVREKWVKAETRPTGSPYPKNHPLIQQYEISLGRVWGFMASAAPGFVTGPQYYVLDVVWTDEDSGNWHRETFYNVTISERSRTSRNIDEGFTDEQVFEAEYMAPPTGSAGPPPPVSTTIPYTVVWVGSDGTVVLYSYDPASHNFTALADTSARAQITYTPDQTGSFAISFGNSGSDSPALATTESGSGIELAGGLIQAAPDLSVTPRLDFYCGNLRVASLDASGNLYAYGFNDGAPAAAAGEFQIYSASTLSLTLAAAGAQATYWDGTVI